MRFFRATINSYNGLIFAVRSEQAIREELVATVVLVLAVELLNTAIEKLADRLTMDHDTKIKNVKDMGSAAVGVTLLMAAIFWLFAIAERLGLF